MEVSILCSSPFGNCDDALRHKKYITTSLKLRALNCYYTFVVGHLNITECGCSLLGNLADCSMKDFDDL